MIARAELHQQMRALKLCSATLSNLKTAFTFTPALNNNGKVSLTGILNRSRES